VQDSGKIREYSCEIATLDRERVEILRSPAQKKRQNSERSTSSAVIEVITAERNLDHQAKLPPKPKISFPGGNPDARNFAKTLHRTASSEWSLYGRIINTPALQLAGNPELRN
jgi:hypothetical protein